MENDKIDKMLSDYYSNIEVPMKFNNIKDKISQPNKNNRKSKYIWQLATICVILLTISTVAFGQNIYYFIIGSMVDIHEGLVTAVKNNYYAEVNMAYIKSGDTSLKVDYVLMDDFNLFLCFDIRTFINLTDCRVLLKDMIITDENKNLIFCDDKNTYEKFCKKNGLEIVGIPRATHTDDGYGIETLEQDENGIKVLYKLYSEGYPHCKELNIEINTIILKGREDVIEKNGIWKIKLKLPEEFYSRENIYYKVKDGSDEKNNIKIDEVIVSNTQTVVKYTGKNEDNLNENDCNMRIENENGENFEYSAINDGYGIIYSSDGTYKNSVPFSLTKYKATDKIYLFITQNGKEYKINLEREYEKK